MELERFNLLDSATAQVGLSSVLGFSEIKKIVSLFINNVLDYCFVFF